MDTVSNAVSAMHTNVWLMPGERVLYDDHQGPRPIACTVVTPPTDRNPTRYTLRTLPWRTEAGSDLPWNALPVSTLTTTTTHVYGPLSAYLQYLIDYTAFYARPGPRPPNQWHNEPLAAQQLAPRLDYALALLRRYRANPCAPAPQRKLSDCAPGDEVLVFDVGPHYPDADAAGYAPSDKPVRGTLLGTEVVPYPTAAFTRLIVDIPDFTGQHVMWHTDPHQVFSLSAAAGPASGLPSFLADIARANRALHSIRQALTALRMDPERNSAAAIQRMEDQFSEAKRHKDGLDRELRDELEFRIITEAPMLP